MSSLTCGVLGNWPPGSTSAGAQGIQRTVRGTVGRCQPSGGGRVPGHRRDGGWGVRGELALAKEVVRTSLRSVET